jgi:hypothetical protein
MVFRVSGGIINDQTLTGGMRFFKIVGPFAWTVSDGTVNLPVSVSGGKPLGPGPFIYYFTVGNNRPVPNSAAAIALKEIGKKADIVLIGLVPDLYAATDEIHIGVSASAFGWGSNIPAYDVPPANADEEQLPTSPTAAATQMEAAIVALTAGGNIDVYVSIGAVPNQQTVPATASITFAAVTVEEVSFSLGALTYYTLA